MLPAKPDANASAEEWHEWEVAFDSAVMSECRSREVKDENGVAFDRIFQGCPVGCKRETLFD